MSTTLESATSTLLANYDLAARAHWSPFGIADTTISRADLEALVTNPDPSIPQDLRDAAQFLLDSDASRNFLDTGGSGTGGVDGIVSREDLQSALAKVQSGDYYGELVATADGNAPLFLPQELTTGADIQAALLDPAVPEQVKDALRLATLSGDGSAPLGLSSLSLQDFAAAAALYNSAEFKALSAGDQKLVSEAFRDGQGSGATTADLQKLLRDPSFQALDAAGRSAKLTEYVVLHSPEYKALPAGDQKLVSDALAAREPGDTGFPASVKHLIESERFGDLDAAERTAVLSQVKNYPESAVASNIERMLAKDWFQGQSFEDKQRSLRTIADMSAYDSGDRAILDNTLDRLLSPDSDYTLSWKNMPPDSKGNITHGYRSADSHDLTLNSYEIDASNDPITSTSERALGVNTLAHEVSHAVNDDSTDQTFDYLNEEYRAWYVGYEAEHGHPPSNQEALERWEYFLNPNGGYAEYSHGIERDFWWDTDGALDKPDEAAKIYQMLSDLTGLEVNADNYKDVLASDPSTWKTDPGGDAATRWASGDDLDN
jgi:hypothetical protein